MTKEEIQITATKAFGSCPTLEFDLLLHSRNDLLFFGEQLNSKFDSELTTLKAELNKVEKERDELKAARKIISDRENEVRADTFKWNYTVVSLQTELDELKFHAEALAENLKETSDAPFTDKFIDYRKAHDVVVSYNAYKEGRKVAPVEKDWTCYEIHRPNIPEYGCEKQCNECKIKEGRK